MNRYVMFLAFSDNGLIYYRIYKNSSGENIRFVSIDHTLLLKDVVRPAILQVHFAKDIGLGVVRFVAAAGILIFLICAGYGLTKFYKKTGNFIRITEIEHAIKKIQSENGEIDLTAPLAGLEHLS